MNSNTPMYYGQNPVGIRKAMIDAGVIDDDTPIVERPTIVCLCGATRFVNTFQLANLTETLAGRIVLTVGCDMHRDGELFAHLTDSERNEIKARLDQLHLRKIDMADEVLILNLSGYIGESTRREWQYALEHGKTIRWLEPDKAITS